LFLQSKLSKFKKQKKTLTMPAKDKSQTNLFGETLVKFEYYPVLLPDDAGIMEIAILNQRLIEHRVKPSGITKLPQVFHYHRK
jgi:hypothetical protein